MNRENETSSNRETFDKNIEKRHRNAQPTSYNYSKSNNDGIREIWIGILSKNVYKQDLFNDFFIFGEIENIDFNTEKVIIILIYIFLF